MMKTLIIALTLFPYALCCPLDFSPWYEGRCFRIYSQASVALNAKNCEADGGHLASIHSETENNLMLIGKEDVWIGLKCVDGKFSWMDGTPVDYTNTKDGCAGEGMGYVLNASTGLWIAKKDDSSIMALCKHRSQNDVVCTDYEHYVGSEGCFSLQTQPETWVDAAARCRRDSAHLISIHDKKTNDQITAKAKLLGINGGLHIGLRSNASLDELKWTDGTSVDFNNYARGFPNDIFGHCAALESNALNGQWMSSHCNSSQLPYVCGRSANTTLALSGCPPKAYFTEESVFYSPSYPLPSGPVSCEYVVEATEEKRVQLYISMETNQCCDRLEVYDGPGEGTLIDTIRGHIYEIGFISIKPNSRMRLKYIATDGTRVRGWKAHFIPTEMPAFSSSL